MKTKLLFTVILFINLSSFSQNYIQISFSDSAVNAQHVWIDTVNFLSNKWQIGTPNKTVFIEPVPNRVIVTDTLYPTNTSDTSVFIVKQYRPFPFGVGQFAITTMQFDYKFHKNIADIAMVEMAADTGMHWVNMLTQDTTYQIQWYGNKPNFNDTSTQWKSFKSNYSQWFSTPYNQGNFPYYADADTFYFRFTFITDSVPSGLAKDGWMIDNMVLTYGIPENVQENNLMNSSILFYPNPMQNTLNIRRGSTAVGKELLKVYAMDGRVIYQTEINSVSSLQIPLEKGFYFLIYQNGDFIKKEKILVE